MQIILGVWATARQDTTPIPKGKAFHQILIDAHGISAQAYLLFYPWPVLLAGMGRDTLFYGYYLSKSRWPGWGILGGHQGLLYLHNTCFHPDRTCS